MLTKSFILFFISSAVWGNAVDGIALPVVGTLFPLRIAVIVYAIIIWYKTFVLGEYIEVLPESSRIHKKLHKTSIVAFTAMMIAGFVTMYWAYNKIFVVIDIVTWITSFLCVAMCVTTLKTKDDVIFASRVFIVNFLIIGGIGIYESFTGDYFNLTYDYYTRHKNIFDMYMPASIMFNINNLAIFMVLSMPICFVGTEGLKGKQFWDFCLMVFGEVVAVLTGCNTALVIFCVVFLMYVYLNREKKSTGVIIVVVIMILIALSSIVVGVFNEILSFAIEDEPRLDLWKNAFGVAKKYWFMGVGPGNSETVNVLYRTVNVAETARAHNYFLTIFEEFGIVGFAFFAWWFVKFIYATFKIHGMAKNTPVKYGVMFIVTFLPSTLCMSSMIGYFYYWAEIGIFVAMMGIVENKTEDFNQYLDSNRLDS